MFGDQSALRRGARRLKKLATPTRVTTISALLLTAGVLMWVPVRWTALAARAWHRLSAWGVFDAPALVTLFGAGGLIAVAAPKGLARIRRSAHSSARPEIRPLRWWVVVLIAIGIATASMTALLWLMGLAAQAPPQDVPKARIDAVRTALTLGAGLVGVVVLVLTARKQWLAERTQRHTETTTADKHVTELYTAAADQLASDKAPVRLAGLYALSRLGQANPDHRQTIVNLFCAYLRMPDPSTAAETATDAAPTAEPAAGARQDGAVQPLLLGVTPALAEAAGLSLDGAEQAQQERQVRLTAQRLLAQHLRPEPDAHGRPTNAEFWGGAASAGLDLDLAGASLYDWDFTGCWAHRADFTGAAFHGEAKFERVRFHNYVRFVQAQFHDLAWYRRTQFHGFAGFDQTQFHGLAGFDQAQFHHIAWFPGAQFHGAVLFQQAQFHDLIRFTETHFQGHPNFSKTWARLDYEAPAKSVWPPRWTAPEGDPGDGRAGRWGMFVSVDPLRRRTDTTDRA